MKKIILFAALALFSCEYHEYKVKIIFCDGRPDKIAFITSDHWPDVFDIDNGPNMGVPQYRDFHNIYYNVCDIQTLKKMK